MPRPLRAWRMDKGWNQERLAAEAGVSPSTISDIENRKRPAVHFSTRKKLADVLGCLPSQVAEFADGDPQQQTHQGGHDPA